MWTESFILLKAHFVAIVVALTENPFDLFYTPYEQVETVTKIIPLLWRVNE